MWKYVTRRLKEAFERKCNAWDVCRSWRCHGSGVGGGTSTSAQQTTISQDDNYYGCEETQFDKNCVKIFSNFYICTVSDGKTSSNGSSDGGKNEKKGKQFRENDQNGIHDDLLGAITWSGAIVCGWYASQLLCLNRRRYGWDQQQSHGRYFNIINIPSREIHTSILSHLVFTSPVQRSLLSEKALKEKFTFDPNENFFKNKKDKQQHFNVFEVNNDNETPSTSGVSSLNSSETPQKQSVNEAINDLVKFLGETEFKLGLKYISNGHYRSAVTHLKLATSHNHVGASFNLGLCYEQGLGVTKNLKRAMECYQYASSMGHAKAMYNLGVYYAQGLGGLNKDHETARQCFITSAKLGQDEAKKVLGWSTIDNDNHPTTQLSSMEKLG